MDIKAKVEELVKKIKADDQLLAKFKASPVETVKSLVGVDFDASQLEGLVTALKSKLSLDSVKDTLGGLLG